MRVAVESDFLTTDSVFSSSMEFDNLPAPVDLRSNIKELEAAIRRDLPLYDIDELTNHDFCDGLYARTLVLPAGSVIVGKTHASENFFLLVAGSIIVTTPEGPKVITAPYLAVTHPGEKRAGFALTDAITMNFHANPLNETDPDTLESMYIITEKSLPVSAKGAS
jgi:hypothetical protein